MTSVDFDDILPKIGKFGKWQKLCVALLWLPPMFAGIHNLLFVFTGLKPSNGYRCKIPECDGDNFNFDDFSLELFPGKDDGSPDYCSYYQPQLVIDVETGDQSCSNNTFNKDHKVSCPRGSQFAYNDFEFKETLVTEWDALCGKQPPIGTIQFVYIFGLLVGSFLCGKLGDMYGRKPGLLFAIILCSSAELIGSFNNYMYGLYTYAVIRFFAGVGQQGLFNLGFGLTIELVDQTYRVPCLPWVSISTLLGISSSAAFAVGIIVLSSFASLFPSWWTLQLAVSCASFLQIFILFIVPESPRWLLSTGRFKEAEKVIKLLAARNGNVEFSKTFKIEMESDSTSEKSSDDVEQKEKTYGFKDLFNRKILVFTLVQMVTWPAVSLGYFGLSYGSSEMKEISL